MIDIIILTKDNPGVFATLNSLYVFHPSLPSSCKISIYDASSDDSLSTSLLLDRLGQHFESISYTHLPPLGIYQTFNLACSQLSSDFVHFLNAGDLFWPFSSDMRLVDISEYLTSRNPCIHVFSSFVNQSSIERVFYKSCLVFNFLAPVYNNFLSGWRIPLFGMPICQQSILYPAAIFRDLNLFFDPSFFPISDYHHLFRSSRHFQIIRHPNVSLSNYNYDGVSSLYDKSLLRSLHVKLVSSFSSGRNQFPLFGSFTLFILLSVKRLKWFLSDILSIN